MPADHNSLLLEVGVPFRLDRDGSVLIEAQAHHGVTCWLDNFDRVTLCACTIPEAHVEKSTQWLPVDDPAFGGRLSVELLPWAYAPGDHIRKVAKIRRRLNSLITQHSHLCFSSLGWLGAWGSVGCEEAVSLNRPYTVWLDWVLHGMPLPATRNPISRLWKKLQREMVRRRSIRDISRSALGLFNGRTVFDAYAPYCKAPRVVHDIHLGEKDIVSEQRLEGRLMRTDGPIKVIYMGRVHQMKGPRHWIDALQIVATTQEGNEISRPVHAAWYGDGPMLNELRQSVKDRNLSDSISFPGSINDRNRLIELVQDADLFVFCHLTPESPRCLIEALMCGVPIVGFESAYASDLLSDHPQGGAFVPVGSSSELAKAILDCVAAPARLRLMSVEARAAGAEFTDTLVFRHRSDLIKQLS